MLDRHKAEVVEQERLKVDIESKADVQKIIESHREEMQKLIRKHEADRRELIRDYEAEKSKISESIGGSVHALLHFGSASLRYVIFSVWNRRPSC